MALLVEGSFGGANVEIRSATLASSTVEVPTKLSKLFGVFVTYAAAPGAATQLVCDKTITDGKVTVADAGGGDKDLTVMLIGLP